MPELSSFWKCISMGLNGAYARFSESFRAQQRVAFPPELAFALRAIQLEESSLRVRASLAFLRSYASQSTTASKHDLMHISASGASVFKKGTISLELAAHTTPSVAPEVPLPPAT
ncbi:hypothetical protein BC834DRAFT_876071 [Gloeopeniophorella convolvens]|nr:hypothetical protein BC834DRAFT_876071 [Gloeopeniophorella convolvens]